MNIVEQMKKRKEDEAARVAAETAEANRLMMEAKASAPGSVSAGMMGSSDVLKDTLGTGQKSPEVESDDQAEGLVDNTPGGAQDASIASKDLESGLVIDPGTKQKFVMPNPLLIKEIVAEPEKVKGPPGSFRAVRLQRFFAPDGTKIVPNEEGFFIPQNQWEFDELHNFANQFGMVEFQGEQEDEK